MPRRQLALIALLLALPVVLHADTTSCSLLASSFGDAVINPPGGEDTDFFVNSGGVPNVMFVLDTSGSMVRMPPDGASGGWGSFQDSSALSGSATGYGCVNTYANTIVFHSACGTTSIEGSQYAGSTGTQVIDFANATDTTGKYCSYMSSGNQPPGTDRPGFDPDFYCTGTGLTCSGAPNFFNKARVYHDAVLTPYGGSSNGDGWSDWDTNPASDTTSTDFCNRVGGTDTAKVGSCNTCMASQGYWFDGSYRSWASAPACSNTADCKVHGYGTCVRDSTGVEYNGATNNLSHCRVPNVWFSGNFLNFYPPKFLMARKVLKDTLSVVRKIRLGLTVFNNQGSNTWGGTLLEALNPGCNMLGSPSSFDSNRTSIKNAINNQNSVSFSGGTPLAETLLNIGQVYTSSSLTWFNSAYQRTGFSEGSGNNKSVCFSCQQSSVIMITDGLPTADGNIPGTGFASTAMTKAVADQTSPKKYAGSSGYNITGITTADCPECNTAAEAPDSSIANGACVGQQASGACDDDNNPIQSYLPKVAWYLKNVDDRSDTETGSDGYTMAQKQAITTYTVGLGTTGNAEQILQHAADMGGGLYNGGSTSPVTDAKALRDAILASLTDVNTRSTSFGAASLSTLQAAASQGVLIPRFEPSRTAHWDGHLYSFRLFSEFTGGCSIPATGPSGPANGDYDCDGKCGSVFLQDKDNDFIMESGTGSFVKNSPPNRASCGSGNLCPSSACASASTTLATPVWDAGDMLAPVKPDGTAKANGAYTDWASRKVYTVVDRNGDGKLTSEDVPLIQLDDSPTQADSLAPYLNIQNSTYCLNLASRLDSVGNSTVAATIRSEYASAPKVYTTCARMMLKYVRGADVFNERQCAGYPASYCTRSYQLGDIFHSSPVEVWAPVPANSILCLNDLHPQCLRSLFEPPTPAPAAVTGHRTAYDDYQQHSDYKHRARFTLVGANDGLLHAFHTASWKAGQDDPGTPQREDQAPYEGYYDSGTGEELWAFLPPDLLAKIPLFLGNTHQYFVDASPMVRDVWIDGGDHPNRSSPSTNHDGVKQGSEFHTVAVVGERRGGTHYFALDVTDAGKDLDVAPKFLWIYPQPNDPEQLAFGETYADFIPTPPPIGPVRIDTGAPPCLNSNTTFQATTGNRCFEERWAVFLSGGFDQQYTRGRGVHLVDIGSGEELFDFSQPPGDGGACTASSDPRCHLNYPVAATVSMMMWGKQANFLHEQQAGYFFDTATFGDTGGQMWALRFSDPGILDPTTHKVNNWYGARLFQMGKTATSPACGLDFCGGQPFFYITANTPLSANGTFRTFSGTGDRYNLLDPSGGVCGPDNLRACVIKGCTVTLDDGSGNPGAAFGVTDLLGTQSYHQNDPAVCSGLVPSTYSLATTSSNSTGSCSGITFRVNGLNISCPGSKTCSGVAESTAKRMSVACSLSGGSGSCAADPMNASGQAIDLKGNPDKRNWFLSMQVFSPSVAARGLFSTLAQAIAFDQERFSETSFVNVNSGTLASPDAVGWSYYFDHGESALSGTQTTTIGGVAYNIYRGDERTASNVAIEASCTFWNTMQTALPQGSFDPTTECPINSPCKAGRAQLSYLYGAAPSTGALCMRGQSVDSSGNPILVRSQKNETLVPPSMGKLVAYVAGGQVTFGLTSVRIPQGGANVTLTDPTDVGALRSWVPVDKQMHDCRHAPGDGPPPNCK